MKLFKKKFSLPRFLPGDIIKLVIKPPSDFSEHAKAFTKELVKSGMPERLIEAFKIKTENPKSITLYTRIEEVYEDSEGFFVYAYSSRGYTDHFTDEQVKDLEVTLVK